MPAISTKKSLTVFTPTFNRAHLLPRLYESLKEQDNPNFLWLVVDDGSSDGTDALVAKWKAEALVSINYVFKENGGMHTAHNVAYSLIDTELNTCVDSDDYLSKRAVSSILSNWKNYSSNNKISGMVGLNEDRNGNVIGSTFPISGQQGSLGFFYRKLGIHGDKKIVYRSEITCGYPKYPEFPGERLVPMSHLYTLIDRDYDLVAINDVWCVVNYQVDGSSSTIRSQYFQSPRGFREFRTVEIKYGVGWLHKLRSIMHYQISCFILNEYRLLIKSPKAILKFLMIPMSFIIFVFLKLCIYFNWKI